ncbi:MAG: helicase-related protein, partial [Dokdonella sp.]
RVLPIYGGQSYGPQLMGLRRGVHVIVGTPGRVIDHLTRGSLDLSELTTLVLDEGDEMLRMGFIDDVEAVLKKTPPTRQIALFSATMPAPIRRIAQTHLRDPIEITIKTKTTTAANTRQRYWMVSGLHKLDALTRILEAETYDAMIVFARTKQATDELAQKLQARGLSAAAINGDLAQAQRERTIQQLKDGKLDILVATDVAARGLDVDRISHVLNYDIPHDTEAYVHRIGRTGRAGRSGEAILFVTPREKRLLQAIERATRQPIAPMELPSVEAVNDQRIGRFKQRISETLAAGDLGFFQQLIEQFEQEQNVPALEIAAALARLVQGDTPLLLEPPKREHRASKFDRDEHKSGKPRWDDRESGDARPRRERADDKRAPRSKKFGESTSASDKHSHKQPLTPLTREDGIDRAPVIERPRFDDDRPRKSFEHAAPDHAHRDTRPRHDERPRKAEAGFETFRVEVGHDHGVKPGNIVGAIANEAGLDSKNIGRIDIRDDHALIDLPEGMPPDIFKILKKVWVSGQQLRITRNGDAPDNAERTPHFPPGAPKPRSAHKKSGRPAGFVKPKRPRKE